MDFFRAPTFSDVKYDDQSQPLAHIDSLKSISDPMVSMALNGYFAKQPTQPQVDKPVPIRDDRPYLTEYDRHIDTRVKPIVGFGTDRKSGYDSVLSKDGVEERSARDLDASKVRLGPTAVWRQRRMDNMYNLDQNQDTQADKWMRQEDEFGYFYDDAARSIGPNSMARAAVELRRSQEQPIKVEQAITANDKMFPRMTRFLEFVRQRYRSYGKQEFSMLASELLRNDRVVMTMAAQSNIPPQFIRNALTYVAENNTLTRAHKEFLYTLWDLVEHVNKFAGPDGAVDPRMPREQLYVAIRYAANKLKYFEEHKSEEIKNMHIVNASLYEMARVGKVYSNKDYIAMEDRIKGIHNLIALYYQKNQVIPAKMRSTIMNNHNIGDNAYRAIMGQIANDLRPQLKTIEDIPLREEIARQYTQHAFMQQNMVQRKNIGDLPEQANWSRVGEGPLGRSSGVKVNTVQMHVDNTSMAKGSSMNMPTDVSKYRVQDDPVHNAWRQGKGAPGFIDTPRGRI